MFKYRNTSSFIFALNCLLICALVLEYVDGALKCSLPNSEEYVCDNVAPEDPECCCFSVRCNEEVYNLTSKGCAASLDEAANVASSQCKLGGMEFETMEKKIMLCKGDMCNAWYPWAKKDRKDEEDITDLGDLNVEEINNRILASVVQEQQQQDQTAKLNCQLIVSGENKSYTDLMAKKRLTYKDPVNLSMECAKIRKRNHFLEKPLSIEEAKFPLAYARIIYQDYRFLEAEFAANYHPQNWYCFAMDIKADPIFQERIHQLAKCFKNLIIPKNKVSVDNSGHGMAKAFMSCLTELAKAEHKWQYVFMLQNHDVQVRTNQEMVQILKWLGGANDIQFEFEHTGPQGMIRDLHQKFDWTFQGLQIFKNDSLNNRTDANGNPLGLRLAKGQVQSSLARPFADFIVHQLNLTKLISHLDSWIYGADELFFQTIGSADHLNAPGGFTHKCYDQRVNVPHITRYTVWNYGPNRWENVGKCYSNMFRHNLCVFGLEDLSMNLRDSRHLFVNKMMPSADFGAVLCWHEEMRRRSMTLEGRQFQRLNPNVYSNWPQTRYLKFIESNKGSQNGNNDGFQCATENVKYDPFRIFRN